MSRFRLWLILLVVAASARGCSCNGGSSTDQPRSVSASTAADVAPGSRERDGAPAPAGPGACPSTAYPAGFCPAGAACGRVLFRNGVAYPVPLDNPERAATGDVDEDGHLDVLACGFDPGFPVLRGDGAGAFTVRPAVGGGARVLRVMDVDHDGHVDLVGSHLRGGGGVEIAYGFGNGRFEIYTEIGRFAEPLGADAVAIDLDGDLDLDLVGSSMQVYRNNGDRTFTAIGPAAAGFASFVVAADLDGDGDLDVVRPMAAGLESWRNTAGAFTRVATSAALSPGLDPPLLVDVDRDGVRDVVVNLNARLVVALGSGAGSFGAPIASAAGTDHFFAAVADYTGDGIADVATGVYDDVVNGYRIRVHPGTGTGSFGAPSSIALPPTMSGMHNPQDGLALDVNADGLADLIVVDTGGDAVSVLLGTGGLDCQVSAMTPTPADPPGDCPPAWTLCAGSALCCPAGWTCAGDACTWTDRPPPSCGPGFCALDEVCNGSGACCPGDHPTACGATCCLPGASCTGGACGCPAGDLACGERCCAAGSACVDGACVAVCGDPSYPTPCDDQCCADGHACVDGACACAGTHPVSCASGVETTCCLDGAPCNGGCGCPPDRAACGDVCCAPGRVCVAGACAADDPPGPGSCPAGQLHASRRACIALQVGGACECTSEPTDSCIPSRVFTDRGLPVPAACTPEAGTPCFFHDPAGVNNFLYRPCCPGLTCMIAPECNGGALDGTCMP